MAFDKQLEEYYKLDFEDLIGDLPTRFKYKQVQPNLYGLSSEDVLLLDDKDLNQHVSLKKLAPYRTEEFVLDKQSRRQLLSKKERKVSAMEYHGDGRVKKSVVVGHGGGEEEEGGERKHGKGGKEKGDGKKKRRRSEGEEVEVEIEEREKVKGKRRKEGGGDVGGERSGGEGKSGGDGGEGGEGVEGGEERKKRKRNKKKSKESAGLSLSRLQSYGQEALPVQNRKKADGGGFFKRLREEAKK